MNKLSHKFQTLQPVTILIAMLISANLSFAQPKAIGMGDRIKIDTYSPVRPVIIGKVIKLTNNSVIILSQNTTESISYTSVKKWYISRDRQRKTKLGVSIGILAGTLAGGALVEANYKAENCEDDFKCDTLNKTIIEPTRGIAIISGVLVGGLAGAGIGAIIGSMINVDKWEEVPVKLHMDISDLNSKAFSTGLRLSLKFNIR